MRGAAGQSGRLRGALCTAVGGWLLSSAPGAGAEIVYSDFSGSLDLESRWFPDPAGYPGQDAGAGSAAVTATLLVEDAAGRSFTVTPFARYDDTDPRRTHADLRRAYALFFGDIGDDLWELRIGVDQVFWGVTESQHLVDIVNQVDLIEHPTGEAKLGQPMVRLTRAGDWGTLEVFALTYHRPRTFPGAAGRLRLPVVVDDGQIVYEHDQAEWHVDLAARYSRSIGSMDLGLSVFDGTSREPFAELGTEPNGAAALIQHYGQIRQFGLDAQWTAGAWLLKLEAIRRAGERNLLGVEAPYAAAVAGGEYAFYSVFGSGIDVSLIGEWNYDARDAHALPRRQPMTLQDDLFVAVRLGFNDVQSTELTVSVLSDRDRNTRVVGAQFARRLSDRWSLQAEAIKLLEVDPLDLYYPVRQDSFIQANLVYFF